MPENEAVKSLIRELLAQGYTLPQVQTELKARGHAMTFMELRLLAAELQDIRWSAPEPPPAPAEKPADAAGSRNEEELSAANAKLNDLLGGKRE